MDTIAFVLIAGGLLGNIAITVFASIRAASAAKVGEKTHALVNSNMGRQLRLNLKLAETLASLTEDPNHVAAADMAREMLEQHDAQQADADD